MMLNNSHGQFTLRRGQYLPLRVLANRSGKYYIGTFSESGLTKFFTRESNEHWDRAYKAEAALMNNTWTQRCR